jgi:cytoskeleton protein RodZ
MLPPGEISLAHSSADTGRDGMKSLGEYLRAERLARGISLEQISADTRISMNMLHAIEDGNNEQLPAPVLIKGFLRAYAKQIGLDPEGVIIEYQDLIEEVDARQEAMEKFHRRLRPKSSRKKLFVLLLALALLLSLTIFLWRSNNVRQPSIPSPSTEPVPATGANKVTSGSDLASRLIQQQSTMPSEQTPGVLGPGIEPASARSELSGQTPPLPSGEKAPTTREGNVYPVAEYRRQVRPLSPSLAPYVLRAETVETTWLHITIDGGREREYLLQPGEQLTWQATSGYKLFVGNAAGVKFYLNDAALKPMGESGRVVRLELPDPSLIFTSDAEQREPVN